jgi:hypothetical protein
MQVPLQSFWPAGQAQALFWQVLPPVQSALEQQPVVATQTPLHSMAPVPQKHWPVWHKPLKPQSGSLQHPVIEAQAPLQTCWPAGQVQAPLALHVWPVTVQSPSLQQFALGMHRLVLAHGRWSPGQAQVPAEHVSPATVHSASVQQLAAGRHRARAAHALSPALHLQVPVAWSHTAPESGQSPSVQQDALRTHAVWQTFSVSAQAQVPSWQVWPAIWVHSASAQQPSVGAQPTGVQALSPLLSSHWHFPSLSWQVPGAS